MTSPRQTAALVIENVPFLMRLLRTKFREKRVGTLSMAQFRMLAFADSNEGACLSEAAEHIGLSLPSMSKLVDSLVKDELMTRHAHGADRRRVCLALTAEGKRELDEAHRHTESFFSERLAELTADERSQVAEAMALLRQLFAAERSPSGPEPKAK